MVLESKKKNVVLNLLEDLKTALMGMSVESLKDDFLEKIFQGMNKTKEISNLTMPMICHSLGIVKDEQTYEALLPKSYKDSNSYDSIKNNLPFLVVNYEQTLNGIQSAGLAVAIYKNGNKCTLSNLSSIGTLTENDQVLVLNSASEKCLVLDIASNLGLDKSILEGVYTIEFMKCTAQTVDEETTYTFEENQFFDLKY